MKIMIVDDHTETRELLHGLLTRFSDEIVECTNGAEAAAQCTRFKPDLVTMDLNMPLTGGMEATRQILAENPSARVIVLTQHEGPEFRLAASRAGACHFFSKDNLVGMLRYLEQQMRFPALAEPALR